MATIFNAVAVLKKGKLLKHQVFHPDNIPLEVKIHQDEVVEVVLIERSAQSLADLEKKARTK